MLDVVDLTVRRGGTVVLRDERLHVADREIVAVQGPSGVGKSTLLAAIAGLVDIESGSVRVDGHEVTGLPTHRRQVGMVFQDEQLFPHLDVAGNIGFALRLAGMSTDAQRRRVEELLTMVHLPGFAGRAVGGLSGGEAKRVALARSLAASPRVLLLDEPLTGLDPALRDSLADDLRAVLVEAGLSVVLVTHDRSEAARLADRVHELHAAPR